MTSDILAPLRSIEAALRQLERPTAPLLRPGAPPETVRSLLSSHGLEPPSDLVALWEWRNGTDTSTAAPLGDLWLVPGFYLLSVDDAVANYAAFVESPRWKASWMPVLADGGGDFMAVNCARGADYGAVYHFRIEESAHPLEFTSVHQMLVTFAAAFERRTFLMDARGYFEVDDAAFADMAAELNPSVEWWRTA